MKRRKYDCTSKVLVQLAILAAIVLFGATSEAAYNCGTGWTAYSVSTGVRCIVYVPAEGGRPEGYVVYGEGTAGGTAKYRHIGALRRVGSTADFTGDIVDISGNGEAFSSYWENFTISRSSNTNYPSSFQASAWNESWTKVGSGQTSNPNYTTVFSSRPRFCGSNFWGGTRPKLRQFKTYRFYHSGTEALTGVICALRLDAAAPPHEFDVALSSGALLTRSNLGTPDAPVPWQESQYMNMVVRQKTSYGQWDLCQLSDFCQAGAFGTVGAATQTLADTGDGVTLTGSFPQTLWIPFTAMYGIRVFGYAATDDNLTRPSGITADDFLTNIQWANYILNRPAESITVQLLYNRSYPSTWDLITLNKTIINNSTDAPTVEQAKWMDYYADQAPDRAVSFYTHGPGTETCSHKGGMSWTNRKWSIVRAPYYGVVACQEDPCNLDWGGDPIHYIHELGHFFGLWHTFVGGGFASVAAASNAWQCVDTNVDGDRGALGTQDDTGPDPYITSQQCSSNTSVTLTYNSCSKSFALQRFNVMSYYLSPLWPWDKYISPGQRSRMSKVIQGTASDVVEPFKTHRTRLY
jgi:hypothetical protein